MRAWNQKMTSKDQEQIIKMYQNGLSASKILKMFNGKFKTTKTIYDTLKKFNINRKEKWEYSNHDHFYFSNINTPNKAYILGLIIADGWVNPTRNEVGIQLQEQDKYIIENIKKEWKTDTKILKCTKKPFTGNNGNTYTPCDMYRIAIKSPKMIEDLAQLGIYHRKSKNITLPCINEFYDSHMFRGIVDGDGSIYIHSNKKQICIRIVGSHYLVAQSCLYLHKRIGVSYRQPSSQGNISYADYNTEDDVTNLIWFLYDHIEDSFCIERKKNVIKDYLF